MKVITFTSYIEYFELHTKIHSSTAVSSCQIKSLMKDTALLSDVALILYKAGLRTFVQDIHLLHQ